MEDMSRKSVLEGASFKVTMEVLSMTAKCVRNLTEQRAEAAHQMAFLVEQGTKRYFHCISIPQVTISQLSCKWRPPNDY